MCPVCELLAHQRIACAWAASAAGWPVEGGWVMTRTNLERKKKIVFHISDPLCVCYASEVYCKVSSEGQNYEGCTFRVARLEFRISAPFNVKIQR